MEKVISLFKSFRNNEIAYDELFGTLTQMLSEDPRFAAEAIATLDNAQQLTPIPVTDFIQLRSQMEATAETFQQQYIAATPADHEATKIFDETAPLAGDETFTSPGSSFDPTLMAAPVVATDYPGEATATATATATEQPGPIDYADEATVIMPMPPRHEPAPPPPAARIADDEHATLVAVASAPPQPEITPPATSEPRPAATSQPSPAVQRAEPADNVPARQPVKKPPFAVFAGGAAVVIIMLLALILWPDGDKDAKTIASSQNSQQQATENLAWQSSSTLNAASSQSSPTSPDPDVFSEPYLSPTAQDEEASQNTPVADVYPDDTTTDEDTDFFDDSNSLALDDVSSTTDNTAPAIVEDAAYFMDQIKTAVSANKLTPAEEEGTATWYLVELIRYDNRGDQISDARTLISQKHLELAKKAREKNQWDAAQQHLDDALKVRLPDSYLP